MATSLYEFESLDPDLYVAHWQRYRRKTLDGEGEPKYKKHGMNIIIF
jgi:hypothetical protein